MSSVMESPLEVVDSVAADERENLPQHLNRLFLYCSLFPFDYEFRKLELVQLWIAEGFIRERQWETMEDTASEHFSSLEEKGFFVCSRCDFTTEFDSVLSAPPTEDPGNFLYKVNPNKHSLLEDAISSGNYFKALDGKLDGVSEMQTRHLSLITEDVDAKAFRILQNLKQLRTLHLLSSCASFVKHVPCDLCFTLKFLRTLNLSGTLISELPSSIGNVKSLRYVDASHTPIARLPESIDSLHNLQTIKLRGCLHFMQLPKGMKKLTKLRHIDLDIIRQLDSLPAHLGNLSDLQTLPAFFVGRDDGCHVTELKNLNGLRGAFTISRLENVSSKEEAEEAALGDKKGIHRLELRWSNLLVEDAVQQEKFLECLQPHFGLEELHIQQYSGSTFPTWISNPSFAYLVGITLYKCRNCKLLPCIGQLPALKSLSLIEVNEVKEINHHFLRTGCSLDHAFPKLERLEVDVMLNLEEWKCVKVGDFPSLVKLIVDSCPKLVTLPALSRLKSLKHLELKRCPKLMSFSSDGLPASLKSLIIVGCLGLKKWLSDHWNMVCHHPSIWFDHEEQKPKEKLSTPPGAAAATKSEEACSSPAVVKQKQKDQMLYPNQLGKQVQIWSPKLFKSKPMTVDIPSVNQKIIAAQYQSPNQLGEQVQIWSPKLFKSKPMTVDIPSVNQKIIAAQYQRDLSLSGMFMDPLVNRDEIRIISNREVEIPQLIQAADNQMILADLDVVKVIGQGEGGVVQLVQHKRTGQFFALKPFQMMDQ